MSDTSPAPEKVSGGIKATLTRKLGPFPAWVYIVAIAGGAWLFYFWKQRQGATPVTPSTAAGTPTPVDTSSLSNANAANPVAQPDSNPLWAVRAANGLIARGTWSATDVNTALSALLNGQPLTPTQSAIVNAAEVTYGVPPEGVIASTSSNAVTSTEFGRVGDTLYKFLSYSDGTKTKQLLSYDQWQPGAAQQGSGTWYSQARADTYTTVGSDGVQQGAPTTATPTPAAAAAAGGHTYTAQTGDTLTSIAMKLYGNPDTSKIMAANPNISSTPNVGQIIVIPA